MFNVQFPAISTSEDWAESYQLNDAEDGDLLDLTGCTISIAVTEPRCTSALLSGSTDDDAVAIVSTGVFSWSFSAAALDNALTPGVYDVGATIVTTDDETIQIFLGKLPVKQGIP
jgi:hypothetical protein